MFVKVRALLRQLVRPRTMQAGVGRYFAFALQVVHKGSPCVRRVSCGDRVGFCRMRFATCVLCIFFPSKKLGAK